MAKKTKESVKPEANVSVSPNAEELNEQAQEKKSAVIVTSEGNTVDKIRIFQKDGSTMVQVDYGKMREGKTSEERRAGMRTQLSRPLSADQAKEYQRIYAESPVLAKDYAARQAYPMHVDDAAFHKKDAVINGRKVDYIIIEKLREEDLSEGNKHLAGAWQLSFGEKDNTESRFFGILNKEELASIRHRAEVILGTEQVKGKDGKTYDRDVVKSIGAPLSLADIASRVEQRVVSQREARQAQLESAQKVDWNKILDSHKLPEGVALTGLRYAPFKDDPNRVWLNGKANGIEVFSLLSKNETTAVKNKIITLEQAAAVNKGFREKVTVIVAPAAAVTLNDAIKAVVDRASSQSAKSFSPEQVKVLNDFAAKASTAEERQNYFDAAWAGAESQLEGVNKVWVNDAHIELNDLAQGIVRSEQQGVKL